MNVLSLFDGMSCCRIALERIGAKVSKYYASEINEHSIAIAQKNYPDTIQLGNVVKLDLNQLLSLDPIDLLAAGTPCKNLSRTVIDRPDHNQGLEGKESKLFYEFVRVLRIVKPKYFLLENVESMKEEDKAIITELLGVEPIMIDSALVSAQDRKRYYWTNIPGIEQPVSRNRDATIINILQLKTPEEKYYYDKPFEYHGRDKKVIATLEVNTHDMLKRVANIYYKCPTLTAVSGGYQEKKIYIPWEQRVRKLTPLEYERLQTVPEGYTEGVNDVHRYSMLGNGWTVDVIAHIFKNMEVIA